MAAKKQNRKPPVGLRNTSTGGKPHRKKPGATGETGEGTGVEEQTETTKTATDAEGENVVTQNNVDDEMVSGLQGIADLAGKHTDTVRQWLQLYPMEEAIGYDGKVNGRYYLTKSDVFKWLTGLVRKLSNRHPYAKKHRPVEAPELQDIKGR